MTELSMIEVRVLGCLIEKEHTTPDQYPLTLNALTLACNQKSNRDPVVSFSQDTVARSLENLREKKLIWQCAPSGSRVSKYQHQFTEAYQLDEAQTAVITVLMLRGPQTTGEIRTRSARIHSFASLEEVAATISELGEREGGPLVTKLPRQVGRKEARYAHLLSGEPDIPENHESEPALVVVQEENKRIEKLEADVLDLREKLEVITTRFDDFRSQFE